MPLSDVVLGTASTVARDGSQLDHLGMLLSDTEMVSSSCNLIVSSAVSGTHTHCCLKLHVERSRS